MLKFLRMLGVWLAFFVLSSTAHAGSPSVLTFTKAFGAASVPLNGSTSLTFNLALDHSANGGGTGAFGFTDTLPAGLVVATPNALSAVTCAVGGGVITATAGSSSISITGLNLSYNQSCTFSVNVTGTSLGVKNNSVTTTAAYIVGSTKTANASITVGPLAPVAPLVPTLPALPPVVGLMNQPTVLDLSGGSGPSMVSCMMSTVRGMLGADATYLGQGANGVVKISQGGRTLSFYPLSASTYSGPPTGITLGSNNALNLTTSCGSFTLSPALNNPTEFGSYLSANGVVGQFDRLGVLAINVGGVVNFVRPDFSTTLGTPGAPVPRWAW